MYIVDFGMTESSWQRRPKQFTAKRSAMRYAAEMVRALGRQAWAYVARPVNRPDGAPEPPIASWRNGKRAA